MGLFDRISRVVRANINDVVSKAEDPEKMLEQSIIDMQEDLVQLRQAVAQAIATQKRTEQQYQKANTEANNWQSRAQLALQKGDESLAREALLRKKANGDTAATLKAQLDQQSGQVENFKRNLIALESKISEAKTKKDMLKARISAAKANEHLESQFALLESGTDVDDELAAMKAQLLGPATPQNQAQLPGASSTNSSPKATPVDDELESLRKQIDQF